MSNSNNKTIDILRNKIKSKKEKLGAKPIPSYITNGVIKLPFPSVSETYNIHTLTIQQASNLLSYFLIKKEGLELVKKEVPSISLETECKTVQNVIDDLKLRILINTWTEEKQNLTAMDKQLEGLLSVKAKAKNAINQISKELNL